MLRKILILVIVVVATILYYSPVSADVGDPEICNTRPILGVSAGGELDGDQDFAQMFDSGNAFVSSGVKISLYKVAGFDSGNITVRLYPTTTNMNGDIVPDYSGGIIESESVNTSEITTVTGSFDPILETFFCESELADFGVIVEWGALQSLQSNTVYAISLTGSLNNVFWKPRADPDNNDFVGGISAFTTSLSDPNNPDNWNPYLTTAATDNAAPFVVYSDIVTPPIGACGFTEGTIDCWFVNFSQSMGLDSPLGKLILGAVFALFIMGLLLAVKVPPLFVMSVGMLSGGAMISALIISEALFLVLIAIAGVGLLIVILSRFLGGERDG